MLGWYIHFSLSMPEREFLDSNFIILSDSSEWVQVNRVLRLPNPSFSQEAFHPRGFQSQTLETTVEALLVQLRQKIQPLRGKEKPKKGE